MKWLPRCDGCPWSGTVCLTDKDVEQCINDNGGE